jgi:hypothetical protein
VTEVRNAINLNSESQFESHPLRVGGFKSLYTGRYPCVSRSDYLVWFVEANFLDLSMFGRMLDEYALLPGHVKKDPQATPTEEHPFQCVWTLCVKFRDVLHLKRRPTSRAGSGPCIAVSRKLAEGTRAGDPRKLT